MEESILLTIKKMIGGVDDDFDESNPFDLDIIVHLNTFFGFLNQMGVGKEGFSISDASATWNDFLGESPVPLNEVKTYLYYRVRLAFDPPTSSIVYQALKEGLEEITWRIITKVETNTMEKS